MNIEAVCSEVGLCFLPFVAEAHGGGFGPAARRVIGGVAKAAAARHNGEPEGQAASTMRRISISTHRENARAVLRRLPGASVPTPAAVPEVWAEDAHMTWQ